MYIYEKNTPLAYSISGGGSHGSWSLGAIKYLLEEGPLWLRKALMFYGCSTGSLICAKLGLSIITGDMSHFEELEKVYRNVKKGDILKIAESDNYALANGVIPLVMGLLGGKNEIAAQIAAAVLADKPSVFQIDPLEDLLDRFMLPNHWRRLVQAGQRKTHPIEVGFCVTSLQTGMSQMITTRTHPKPEILRKALLASTCEPFLMPAIDIFDDGEQWVDGGARDINPVKYLANSPIFKKVKSIVAVSSQRYQQNRTTEKYTDLLSTLLRTISILVQGVYDDDEDFMGAMYKNLNIPIASLTPTEELEGEGLDFEPDIMSDKIKRGFKDAKKVLKFG